ncbi:DUF1648 domain-containing protein [Gordonia sp. (in: high G+C Gram-positive bacteria)]|uniref:DUF1648 domain-containing protein n=1 Tax=Gordonia sp. (in: high G+C Gram-positive bacteria) TaxID=84139 RepID=UPI00262BFDCC|nr:DUF1648 domain-containing protein [Gordonia sp. (in: high G+C Gram-positive bacteria)]
MSPNDPARRTLTDDELARRRPLIAFVTVAVVIPALIVGVATIVQISLLGSLPADIAVHWNLHGDPDRWLPAWSAPLVTALLGFGLIGLTAGPAVKPIAEGDAGAVYRLLGGVSLGSSILVAIALAGSVWYQTGDDASVPIVTVVAVAGLLAVAVGALAGLLLPQAPRSRRSVAVDPLPLEAGENTVWLRTTTASPSLLAITVAGFVVALLTTLYSWADGQRAAIVIGAAVIAVAIVVAAVATIAFRVRVSADGLQVRSLAGFPRLHVPLDEIVDVRVNSEVHPIGDFGGYGIRVTARRTGVVPRAGEGIVVDRTGDREFCVVVDDAVTGAALLAALADRAKEVDQ